MDDDFFKKFQGQIEAIGKEGVIGLMRSAKLEIAKKRKVKNNVFDQWKEFNRQNIINNDNPLIYNNVIENKKDKKDKKSNQPNIKNTHLKENINIYKRIGTQDNSERKYELKNKHILSRVQTQSTRTEPKKIYENFIKKTEDQNKNKIIKMNPKLKILSYNSIKYLIDQQHPSPDLKRIHKLKNSYIANNNNLKNEKKYKLNNISDLEKKIKNDYEKKFNNLASNISKEKNYLNEITEQTNLILKKQSQNINNYTNRNINLKKNHLNILFNNSNNEACKSYNGEEKNLNKNNNGYYNMTPNTAKWNNRFSFIQEENAKGKYFTKNYGIKSTDQSQNINNLRFKNDPLEYKNIRIKRKSQFNNNNKLYHSDNHNINNNNNLYYNNYIYNDYNINDNHFAASQNENINNNYQKYQQDSLRKYNDIYDYTNRKIKNPSSQNLLTSSDGNIYNENKAKNNLTNNELYLLLSQRQSYQDYLPSTSKFKK